MENTLGVQIVYSFQQFLHYAEHLLPGDNFLFHNEAAEGFLVIFLNDVNSVLSLIDSLEVANALMDTLRKYLELFEECFLKIGKKVPDPCHLPWRNMRIF
jgi:hypothetical protein